MERYGREKLQLICVFSSFSFTVAWAQFIRCCKQLSRGRQLKRLLMVRCVICRRGEDPNPLNSCTRYPCVPRRLFGDRWRPAANDENQVQIVLCGDWDALLSAWQQSPHQCSRRVLEFPNQACQQENVRLQKEITLELLGIQCVSRCF